MDCRKVPGGRAWRPCPGESRDYSWRSPAYNKTLPEAPAPALGRRERLRLYRGASMRRLVFASVVVLVGFSFALAEEFSANISKVDGNKITFQKTEKGKKVGEAMTLTAADNVKVAKGKKDKDTKKLEVGDAIEGGLKAKMFTEIGEKGISARITEEGGKITQILITGKKQKNQ